MAAFAGGGRAVLVLASVALTLGAAEAGLRIFGDQPDATSLRGLHEVRADRPWLYGMRPGAEVRIESAGGIEYRINADGFRDRSRTRAKPPGVVRVAVLGDSIAFGYGVTLEDSFPAVLESLARERQPAAGIEVLNFGVNGYNPYNEAALLADVVVGYEPDIVLVQFCINDLNDPTLHFDASTHLALDAIPEAAFPNPALREPPVNAGLAAMCERSRLCALVVRRAGWLGELDEATWRSAFAPRDESGPEWVWLGERYAEMAATAADAGARLVVLAVPHRAQIDGTASDALQRRLTALGRAGGWDTIDLLPALRDAAADDPTPLFADLWHPTPRGHRVIADAILQSDALAPPRSSSSREPPDGDSPD